MRYLFGFLCVCALGAAPQIGCGYEFMEGWEDPCEGVDRDNDSVCTRDYCTWGFGATCHHDPVNNGKVCNLDGTTGTCLNGLCGAEHLCDGVACDDGNLCTEGACMWDGSCVFETIVSCNDGNQWTSDECDPDTGECHNEPHTGGSCWFCVGDSCPNCPPEPYGRPFRCEDGACVCWL